MGQQKILEVLHSGKASNFRLSKINRSKLYGSKHRIAIDAQRQECSRAALTRDGRFILPNGGTALLYLDEQDDVVGRDHIQATDPAENSMVSKQTTTDTVIEIAQTVWATDVLDCSITHAYALEPVFICAELEVSLSQGTIYRLPEYNNRQVFLLSNDVGYFLLFGEATGFEFIGLAEADVSPPDLDFEDADDDLDFSMF
jgi:hypothetical protein